MIERYDASNLTRTFIAGLLAALPLLATLLVLAWAGGLLYGWLGPDSLVGSVFVQLGLGVSGSRWVGYLLGAIIIVGAIFALGLLVEAGLQRGLARLVRAVVGRIPLARNIYDLVNRFVDMLGERDADGLKSMSPVWVSFGGPGGVKVLGLLSTPEPVRIGEIDYLAVLVPTSPVPVGGGLIYVPSDWVQPAEVGVEGLTSIYVSMGITSAQHLGEAKGR